MSRLLIVGASKGLGRAFVDGLGNPGDTVIGVSRQRPDPFPYRKGIKVEWIEADFSTPASAVGAVSDQIGSRKLDTVIYNLGIWERRAFEDDYAFLADSDEDIACMISTNITAAILLVKKMLPLLLQSERPKLILTGSTSALRQSGRPEVTFGASKTALNGIADALREGFRDKRLGVTTLQLGYLNTIDGLSVDREVASARGDGSMIPVHDVVDIVRSALGLSSSSFLREIVMPGIEDKRF